MNTNRIVIRSWITLAIAIFAWCAVGYFIFVVFQMQAEHAQYVTDAAAANLEEGQAAQLRALARETESDRTALVNASNIDVLTAVNQIESVHASGTAVHVTSANPIKASGKNAPQLNAIDLTAHADGTFSSVMHVAQTLETLPLSTIVQEIDLSRSSIDLNAKNQQSQWSLDVRVRFYTSAALST